MLLSVHVTGFGAMRTGSVCIVVTMIGRHMTGRMYGDDELYTSLCLLL